MINRCEFCGFITCVEGFDFEEAAQMEEEHKKLEEEGKKNQSVFFERSICFNCLKSRPKRAKKVLAKILKMIKNRKTSLRIEHYERLKQKLGCCE